MQVATLCATLAIAAAIAAAGSARQARFAARVDLVQVDALVTSGGRPVAGLAAEDFELRDNGVVQRIESVRAGDVPLDLILVLDASGSVEGEPLQRLREAAAATLTALRPNDRAGLVGFAGRVAWLAPLTSDLESLRAAAHRIQAGGLTSFHDALFCALLASGAPGRRTLLLAYTDGLDTASWLDAEAVAGLASRSDVVISVVTVPVRARRKGLFWIEEGRRRGALAGLAEATGGALLPAERAGHVRRAFARTVEEFRNRYLITYYPEGVPRPGWHAIELQVPGRRASVRTRRGYHAD